MKKLPLALCLFAAATGRLAAQTSSGGDESNDTLRTYRLGEVTVFGDTMRSVTPTTVQQVPFARIQQTDAQTAAGVVYQIPAARVQTNSRGESLVYLRNAAERQVALYFDGSLMNVPWDNRVDMSLVPAGVIGGMTVSKGAPSVLYGPNTMGGAINMVSLDKREPGFATEFQSQAGTNGVLGGSLVHMGHSGSLRYIGEVGYSSRDGYRLPKDASLPFNQTSTELRTNTDQRVFNLYARGENKFSETAELGLAVQYNNAEKGVAPEGHVEGARFWRYPLWQGLTVSLNSEVLFGSGNEWSFHGAAWRTQFAQDIAQFKDATYSLRTAQEEDRDVTLGTRLLLRRTLGDGGITLAINGLSSDHDQRDLRYDSTGTLVQLKDSTGANIPYPTLAYRQQIYSVGLEGEQRFGSLSATLGASYDAMSTPLTGDKPTQDPFSDISLVGGVAYDINEMLAVRASGGRKTRFPTMRELYGEALRRFVLNPSLKPEETFVVEGGFEGRGDWGSASLVGFSYDTKNTIDQRNFDTLGGAKRQRINIPGSRTFGVEVTGSLRALRPLRLDAHFTYANTRGRNTSGDSTFFLAEKPEMVSTITAEYPFEFGLLPSVEIVHTGVAYSPNDDGELMELAPSTVFNVRLAYRFTPWGTTLAQIYARVNNLTDTLVLPQYGLPGAGREIVAGVKFAL